MSITIFAVIFIILVLHYLFPGEFFKAINIKKLNIIQKKLTVLLNNGRNLKSIHYLKWNLYKIIFPNPYKSQTLKIWALFLHNLFKKRVLILKIQILQRLNLSKKLIKNSHTENMVWSCNNSIQNKFILTWKYLLKKGSPVKWNLSTLILSQEKLFCKIWH